jgi:hypothetical protein
VRCGSEGSGVWGVRVGECGSGSGVWECKCIVSVCSGGQCKADEVRVGKIAMRDRVVR